MRAAIFQFFLTVCFGFSMARAQQTADRKTVQPASKSEHESSPSENKRITTPRPSPEIERLIEAFSGTWSIVINVEPNERVPKGGGGRGEEVWRPGPGRFSLIEEYRSSGDEGELSGLGVAWWDKNSRRYEVMWCASGNAQGCIAMKDGAKWEGKQVVATDESESAGKKIVFKEIFTDITENSFTQTLYQGEVGGDLKRLLTITATREKTPRPPQRDVFAPKSHESQVQSIKMPGPEVQNRMLGTWSLTLKYEPNKERPNGATGRATEVWWAGPGGYSVIEESYQNDANEHVEEFSPAWWDPQAGGQRFLFCSNSLPDGCYVPQNVFRWEGENLVYRDERESAGKVITYLVVFTDITRNSFTEVTQEGESGKTLRSTLTMRATKVVPTATSKDGGRH